MGNGSFDKVRKELNNRQINNLLVQIMKKKKDKR